MKWIPPYDRPANSLDRYVDLNAATGTDGSIIPAAVINILQDEILNVITHAGLTPNGTDPTQLRQAILALLPTPTGAPADASLVHWGTDTGAQNALVVTPSPAFTSLAPGFQLWTVPAFSNSGAATITLTPSAGAAITRNIRRRDGSALQAGDIVAGALICLTVDATGVLRLHRDQTGLIGVQFFNTTANYTPTPGAKTIVALATGGGGAGGSSNGLAGLCGSGGESGTTALYFGPAIGQLATIGAGGAPAASSAATMTQAGSGGQTSFGSLAIAPGGQGGWNSVGAGPGVGGTSGGTGVFIIRSRPGSGVVGNAWGAGLGVRGGDGGASMWGGPGLGADANISGAGSAVATAGGAANGPGSGGGGGDSGVVAAVAGGAGASGLVAVFEFA